MTTLDLRADNWTRSFCFGNPRWDSPAVAIAASRVLVLVHGFNVDDPSKAYGVIGARMGDSYDHIIGVRWPGSVLVAGFLLASMRARKAGTLLARELAWVASRNHADIVVDIEAHSLGCAVALEAVKAGLRVRNLILANAAVDNESVEYGQKYGGCIPSARNVLLAIDRNDGVLNSAYTMAKRDRALGQCGPENPANAPKSIRVVDLTGKASGHSGAKDCEEFYSAWRGLL